MARRRPSPYAGAPDRPVFIGACPRSGTTLLRTMLNTHPDLAIPRETRFLPGIWDTRDRMGDLSDDANRRRLARRVAHPKHSTSARMGVRPRQLVKRMMDAPPTIGSLLGTPFVAYADVTGKKRWGDKRPMYSRTLDAIFAMFPDAQFINVVRDPRAAVASMRNVGWYKGEIFHSLELWDRSVRAVDPWRRHLAPDQLIDVRYEDLVADPRGTLEQLTDFLTLDSDAIDAMLRFYENLDEHSARYHSRLSGPVSTATVEAWQRLLTEDEIALVEHVTREHLERFGHAPVAGGAQPPKTLLNRYRREVKKRREERRHVQRHLIKLSYTYRLPAAARLTSGQLAGHPPVSTPPPWQRYIGRPR